MSCLHTLLKVAEGFAYISAGGSALVAVISYSKNNAIKRGEWLKSLFEKFYEGRTFARIRREIEYDRIKDYLEVDETDGEAKNERHEEELVNYLNFFELLAILKEEGHLENEEIQMFSYFLKAIKTNEFLKHYITKYGFKKLDNFLLNYE